MWGIQLEISTHGEGGGIERGGRRGGCWALCIGERVRVSLIVRLEFGLELGIMYNVGEWGAFVMRCVVREGELECVE